MSPEWHINYKVNINEEITNNLPGIDASRVKTIAIILFVKATHPRAGAELTVGEIELWYK